MADLNLIRITRPRQPAPVKSQQTFTPADAERTGMLVRTHVNYEAIVRRGQDSNVVMAPVQWVMRTFPEAPAIVEKKVKGQWQLAEDHELTMLLEAPNDAYDGVLLAQAGMISWWLDGNVYQRKVRDRFGRVVELWYVPHWMMRPMWPADGSVFISHYDYTPLGGGATQRLPPRDVVHLRFGLDPRNPRLGLSPLRALMREVYTDEEASNYSAAMLTNLGVPGVVIAPKDGAARPTGDDVEATKAYVQKAFTGDHRGEPLVMSGATEVSQFGIDPSKMMVANVRDVAEERVCAAMGLPAAVVGFGAGLQSTKVGATMRELVRLAWVQCLIPTQNSIARQYSRQLLADFEVRPRRARIRFDQSQVAAFQEEESEKVKRVTMKVSNGLQRVDQGQEELGMAPDPMQRIYLRPVNLQAYDEQGRPVGATATPVPAPVPAPGATEEPPPAPHDDVDDEDEDTQPEGTP